jgi:hypothetical protein
MALQHLAKDILDGPLPLSFVRRCLLLRKFDG